MAKYFAGKVVRIGNSHYGPGEPLPDSVAQLSNLKECLADGTITEGAPSSSSAPAEIPAPAVTPAPAPSGKLKSK